MGQTKKLAQYISYQDAHSWQEKLEKFLHTYKQPNETSQKIILHPSTELPQNLAKKRTPMVTESWLIYACLIIGYYLFYIGGKHHRNFAAKKWFSKIH